MLWKNKKEDNYRWTFSSRLNMNENNDQNKELSNLVIFPNLGQKAFEVFSDLNQENWNSASDFLLEDLDHLVENEEEAVTYQSLEEFMKKNDHGHNLDHSQSKTTQNSSTADLKASTEQNLIVQISDNLELIRNLKLKIQFYLEEIEIYSLNRK